MYRYVIYVGLKIPSIWVLWGLTICYMGTWTSWALQTNYSSSTIMNHPQKTVPILQIPLKKVRAHPRARRLGVGPVRALRYWSLPQGLSLFVGAVVPQAGEIIASSNEVTLHAIYCCIGNTPSMPWSRIWNQ